MLRVERCYQIAAPLGVIHGDRLERRPSLRKGVAGHQGIGLPCFFIPLSAVTLSRISDEKLAAASGMSNFLRTLSAALGTALSVTWWDNRAAHHYGTLAQSVTPALTGWIMQGLSLATPFFLGGGLKIVYDLLLYNTIRNVRTR